QEGRLVRVHDGVHRAEVSRKVACGGFADMADTQCVQQAAQGWLARSVQRCYELLGGFAPHALVCRELVRVQCEQIRQRFDPSAFHQLVDQLFTQAFDVQRLASRGMADALLALRGAKQATRAARYGLALRALYGGSADRTACRYGEKGRA